MKRNRTDLVCRCGDNPRNTGSKCAAQSYLKPQFNGLSQSECERAVGASFLLTFKQSSPAQRRITSKQAATCPCLHALTQSCDRLCGDSVFSICPALLVSLMKYFVLFCLFGLLASGNGDDRETQRPRLPTMYLVCRGLPPVIVCAFVVEFHCVNSGCHTGELQGVTAVCVT